MVDSDNMPIASDSVYSSFRQTFSVTVTLTFDPLLPISIGSEQVHLAKTASKSVHPFGWNFVRKNSAGQTDTYTGTQQTNCDENITP